MCRSIASVIVKDDLNVTRHRFHYMLTYSFFLTPIEVCFSKFKELVKKKKNLIIADSIKMHLDNTQKNAALYSVGTVYSYVIYKGNYHGWIDVYVISKFLL